MMDPEVLAAWLSDQFADPNGFIESVPVREMAEALVGEFVLRRRQPPLDDEYPYQRKWNNPNLPTFRTIEISD